jgi:type IV pilus assembly protein PilY1
MNKNKIIIGIGYLFAANTFAAGLVSPSKEPLETQGIQGARPNIMYILDNSKNMDKAYFNDEMATKICKDSANSFSRVCASDSTQPGVNLSSFPAFDIMGDANNNLVGDVPFMSSEINSLFYNPEEEYMAPKKSSGVSIGNENIEGAKRNGFYSASSTINLKSGQKEVYFCTKTNPTIDELKDPTKSVCKRNGFTNQSGNPFLYHATTTYPNATYKHAVAAYTDVNKPFYYKATSAEWCTDLAGANCDLASGIATNKLGNYPYKPLVRWCLEESVATQATTPTGLYKTGANKNKALCVVTRSDVYKYPRYGFFQRVEVPETSYQNYANWYSFYRTRFLSLKTASSLAFADLGSSRRIGFITTNPSGYLGANEFVPIGSFDSTQSAKFYYALFNSTVNAEEGSRLRQTLSKVGRYYAGKTDGINTGMITDSIKYETTDVLGTTMFTDGTTMVTDGSTQSTRPDPVTYSCQENNAIVASASYWSDDGRSYQGQDLEGNVIGGEDNTASTYVSREGATLDGLGAKGTLADVAMYYYKNDLRPDGSKNLTTGEYVHENNVAVSIRDSNPQQHMVTYAISMGLNGFMKYVPDYEMSSFGDVQNIRVSAPATELVCSWTVGTCDWPAPTADTKSTIDDIWHAAVNGRGKFYNVENANSFKVGLLKSLSNLIVQTSSSAAAATSSPNITSTDNTLFYTTYRTSKWDGDISAKAIDPTTGSLGTVSKWSARTELNKLASSNTDSRKIYYVTNSSTPALTEFKADSMDANTLAYFEKHCSNGNLSQCVDRQYETTQIAEMDGGVNLVNYLRGQTQNELRQQTNNYFRSRDFVLGDIVNSSPVFAGASRYNWEATDATYTDHKTMTVTREKMLYAGANDGMIHAFNATTGVEQWAVIPNQMLSKMHELANESYIHDFYVDGTITVMDAKVGTEWKTILIAGMGAGGTGYIAIDITNPISSKQGGGPKVMWEICKSGCSKSYSDLGYSYGNPIITQRAFDKKWVAYVTSGYDNDSGKGILYELDLADGSILRKLETSTKGLSADNQVGLAKINALFDNFDAENIATSIYAGDLNGAVWKWDLSDESQTVGTLLGTANELTAAGGTKTQPITTRIELGKVNDNVMLFFGTGKYLNFEDQQSKDINSVYGLKDNSLENGNLRTALIEQKITVGTITSSSTTKDVDLNSDKGWFFDLKSQAGERVNVDPILAIGTLNVISNVPAESVCTAGGNSWYYQVNYKNGGALPGKNDVIANKVLGGFVVGQVIVRLSGSGILKNFITDSIGSVTPTAMSINSDAVADGASNIGKSSWREIYRK